MSTVSGIGLAGSHIAAILEKINEHIQATDVDGSGTLSKTEITDAFAARGSDSSRVADIFDRFDADGDGLISQPEHQDGFLSRAYRMDKLPVHGPAGNGGALDSLTSLLQKISPLLEGEEQKSQLLVLQDQVSAGVLSKENVIDVLNFLADALPPVDSIA